MQRPTTTPNFLGPVGRNVASFDEQVQCYLDTFCPGWRTLAAGASANIIDSATSHLIPRIFEYVRADISDQAVHTFPQVIGKRQGDEAENAVYRAIYDSTLDGMQAPFMAIANLKVNTKLLEAIFPREKFPEARWKEAEYDFVLIGPHIGLIFIEVKSFEYKPDKHFKAKDTIFPKEFKGGVSQLNNIKHFIDSCRSVRTNPIPDSNIRKFLFTPNVERAIYESWFDKLTDGKKDFLSKELGSINLLFKEDMDFDSRSDSRPCFGRTLKKILWNSQTYKIDQNLYEIYGRLLIGISTMTGTIQKVGLEEDDFDKIGAIMSNYDRIKFQNPANQGSQPDDKCGLLKYVCHISGTSRRKAVEKLSIALLTPDQLSVLEGGNHQILMGAAGTGKTILLQAKALELLSLGESISVVAPLNLRLEYKTIFDSYDYGNYKLYDWRIFIDSKVAKVVKGRKLPVGKSKAKMSQEIIDAMANGSEVPEDNSLWTALIDTFSNDHVLMDEATASIVRREYLNASLALLALMKSKYPTKTAWIAFDPRLYDTENLFALRSLLDKVGVPEVKLKHIMRSSEEVYRICHERIYNRGRQKKSVRKLLSRQDGKSAEIDIIARTGKSSHKNGYVWQVGMPCVELGHKIQGIPPTIIERNFKTTTEAAKHMLTEGLPAVLRALNITKEPPHPIGIIVHGTMCNPAIMTELLNLIKIYCPILTAGFTAPMIAGHDQFQYLRHESTRHVMPDSYASNPNLKQMFSSDIITSKMDFPKRDTSVEICTSAQALSLEWPFVIILSIVHESLTQMSVQRYMLHSRAVVSFIELHYTCKRQYSTNNVHTLLQLYGILPP